MLTGQGATVYFAEVAATIEREGGAAGTAAFRLQENSGPSAPRSAASTVLPFRSAANAAGPVFAALCFDFSGSYTFPFYLFVTFFFIAGAISRRLQPPWHAAKSRIAVSDQ